MKNQNAILNDKVREIADLLNLATSKKEATEKKQKQYLRLENAPIYGGYRLINVGVENGAHYNEIGYSSIEPRLKPQ